MNRGVASPVRTAGAVFCLPSPICYLQSAISYLLSPVCRLLSAISYLLSPICYLLVLTSPVLAQPAIVCDADSDCFYVPDTSSRLRPALLVLSCVGATSHDLDSNMVIADSLGWILASCHGSRNHRTGADNDQDIMKTLSKLLSGYPVDPDRIYICGFSGMGIQALDEVVLHPGFFRGAVQSCAPWRELPAPDAAITAGHAVYLITRQGDWNREGNGQWQRYFQGLGVTTKLVVTEGNHEPGGPKELLEGCRWLLDNTGND